MWFSCLEIINYIDICTEISKSVCSPPRDLFTIDFSEITKVFIITC
jgi:hypothetical protein